MRRKEPHFVRHTKYAVALSKFRRGVLSSDPAIVSASLAAIDLLIKMETDLAEAYAALEVKPPSPSDSAPLEPLS